MKTTKTSQAKPTTSKAKASASDAVQATESAGIKFGSSLLTQDRVNKIESAFASAKGRLKAVESLAVQQGILRAGADWLGESVIRTDASQASRIASKLERAGIISQGDAKALKEYMSLRNAFTALGL